MRLSSALQPDKKFLPALIFEQLMLPRSIAVREENPLNMPDTSGFRNTVPPAGLLRCRTPSSVYQA